MNLDRSKVDVRHALGILDILAHRGPDGQGFYSGESVFLGHRRLSIIDLEGGKQPIYNEDGSVLVIGNGEIYNHLELRHELEKKGHAFSTRSDTEVLVHLYEEEGEAFLGRLNGMFAFAIYDTRSNALFLARDRIGIKPLYFYMDGKQFIFSSEMKTIIKSGLITLEVDDRAVYQYLTLHHHIPPDTLIRSIKSIKPGHYLRIGDRTMEQVGYWDIQDNLHSSMPSFEEATHMVESLLLDSVDKRLMSDVPLGLFLSGGIDSSLMAVLMHRIVGSGIKTFSIGFEERKYSELPYSKRISDMIESDHEEIVVSARDMMENIENVLWYRETPISEASDIPIHLLSRAASKDVKVVLTGEGGDEVFCGYHKYLFEELARYTGMLGFPVMRAILQGKIVRAVLPQRLNGAIELLSERDRYSRFYKWFSFFREEDLKDIMVPEKLSLLGGWRSYADVLGGKQFNSSIEEMQYLDIKVWLPANLLLRGDRMSMGSSLEARVPFLDHRLVELSFRMPVHYKVNRFRGKYIIKKIAEKYLPREIVHRKKVGFTVPIGGWLRQELKELLIDNLLQSGSFCSTYIMRKDIERLITDHIESKRDNHKKLWILLNLELWNKLFMSR